MANRFGREARPVIITAVRHLRALGVVLLAAVIGMLPILPSEHVHETEVQTGHPHLVTHRHAEPHPFLHHDLQHPVFTDLDPIVTLEPVFTAPAKVQVSPPVFAAVMLVEPLVRARHGSPPELVTYPIHGPPRSPAGLRAPPNFTLL